MGAFLRVGLLLSCGFLGLSAMAPLAAAGEPNVPTRFEVVWNTQPTTLEVPTRLAVKGAKHIASTRLIPTRLFILDADAVSTTRGLIAVRDSDLALAEADGGGISACIINSMAVKYRTGRTSRANRINTCLWDADSDGRFDHFFAYRSADFTLGAVGKASGVEEIVPTAYRQEVPSRARDGWAISVRARTGWGPTQLDLCFGPDLGARNPMCLSPPMKVGDRQLPSDVNIAGAIFHLERQANGSVLIEQRTGFSLHPIHIKNWLSR